MRNPALDRWQPLAPRALRVCVALVFIVAGASKLAAPYETARILDEHGIPWPTLMGPALGVFEMLAGALLLARRFVPVVAVVLAAHVFALSLVFHLPFGLPAGAAHTQWINVTFDLLALGALYAVATWRPLDR